MKIVWKIKNIPFKHQPEIMKIYSGCIKRSTTEDQRKAFKELKGYKIEDAIEAQGDENNLWPYVNEKDVPDDILEIIRGCYAGAHNIYCKDNGLGEPDEDDKK